MKRIAVVFESLNFYGTPTLMKVVVIEVNLTDEEYDAVEGSLLEAAEHRIWTRLHMVAGMPPPGWSSWLGGHRWHLVPEGWR
jgi:hypothetical protein